MTDLTITDIDELKALAPRTFFTCANGFEWLSQRPHPSMSGDSARLTFVRLNEPVAMCAATQIALPALVHVTTPIPSPEVDPIGVYVDAVTASAQVIEYEPDQWFAEIPGLPGAWADGSTAAGALDDLVGAVRAWVEVRLILGLDIPAAPTSRAA